MFYEIGETEILDVLNYSEGIFSDTLPFLLLVSGVIVSMYILGGLINNNKE